MLVSICSFLSFALLSGGAVGKNDVLILGRKLKGGCEGEVIDEFYNVVIDLEKFKGDCDDRDMYEMGKIIQDVVREVDQQVPENTGDKMKTMMCTVPEANEVSTRFLRTFDDWHRKLGRYTYRGGGLCRRCLPDDTDRRLEEASYDPRALGDDDEYTSEAVCEMADTANMNKLKALAAAESLDEAVQEFTDVAQALKDEGKRENNIKKMEPKVEKCKERVESVVAAVDLSVKFCEKSQETDEEEKLKECFKDTEKEAKRSFQYGEKAWDECWLATSVVHGFTIDMKRLINKQEFDNQMDTIKARNEEQKASIGPAVSDIEDKIEELEEKIKNEKNEGRKQKYENQIERLKEEIEEIEGPVKEAKKLMVEEAKWEKDITELILDVEEAEDEKEWCKKFAELVAEYVPQRLVQEYNFQQSKGCLDRNDEPTVKVEVYPDLDEKEVVTSRDCEKF